jgi:hypothetical protein
MLTQLTELLASKESGLSLAEISRALGAQPSAVMAMLTLLVQKGRLVEIGPDGGYCAGCGSQSDCNLLAARGKRYAAASVQSRDIAPTCFNG